MLLPRKMLIGGGLGASPGVIDLRDASADDYTGRVYLARITLNLSGICTQAGDSVSPGAWTWLDNTAYIDDFEFRWQYNSGSTVSGPPENTWTDFSSAITMQCTTTSFSSNSINVEIRDVLTGIVRDSATWTLTAGA